MKTKTLTCETCKLPMTATGLLQKINPPNYQYRCLTGHNHWIKAVEAEAQEATCSEPA